MKPTFNKKRPLSWSSLSSFEYDAEEWYVKYCIHGDCRRETDDEEAFCVVAGCADPDCPVVKTTKEMMFGKYFALSIEDGTCSISELMEKLKGKKEHPFKVKFDGIELVGYADDFDDKNFKTLNEVKTGKKKWDQKRADEHKQIDMYLLMNYLINKIPPEKVKCFLHWLPTQDNGDFSITFIEPVKVHTFETKRDMIQILKFGAEIKKTRAAMEAYCLAHA